MEQARREELGGGIVVYTTPEHAAMTDAFLLSYFATPRRDHTACDLGCGCGIIPLLWMREARTVPKYAAGLELQPAAAELARRSVRDSGVADKLRIVQGDLRALDGLAAELPPGSFDLVTCNPPYKPVGAGVMSAGERDQTARHETACTIGDVCGAAARLLRYGGRFCLCQLPERLPDVLEAMRAHKIEPKRLRFVQERADRAPWLLLAEGRLGSRPFLQVEKPLIMREGGGDSPELREIYRLYRKDDGKGKDCVKG